MISLDGGQKKRLLQKLKLNPLKHIEKIQGVTTVEEYQKRVIISVSENERTAVAACHDVGKTFIAAKVVLWFTSTFQGAKVITTAPTFKQVRMLLWSEIRSGFNKSKMPLGGAMGVTHWQIDDDWFAIGYTSKPDSGSGEEQGQSSSFQGYHGEHVLVVFDEATGIMKNIWVQMEGLMTSASVKFLAIGNPTTKSCEFFQCFSDPAYHKIYLNCFDSPNFIANKLTNKADLITEVDRLNQLPQIEQGNALAAYKVVNTKLLSVRWVMRMILKWGIDHPLVVSKCFGEFPEDDEHSLVHLGVVQAAQFRTYTPKPDDRIAIGVDVARFGSDKTIITKIVGKQVTDRKVMVKRDTNEISGELVRMIKESNHHDIHVAIDATGIGAGVVDILKERRNDKTIPDTVEIRECHFGAGPGGAKGSEKEKEFKGKFVNLKARIFVDLSQDLKADLCLLDEDVYLEELPTIQYKFDSKGRWQIESKDEYRARTGRSSPDDADSLALANYARYDAPGVGNFTRDLIQRENKTIIKHSRGENQW